MIPTLAHLLRLAAPGLLLCLVALSGCSLGPLDGERRDLEENRALWEERGFTDYSFDVSVGCFECPSTLWPATIVVREGAVSEVLDPKTGETKRRPMTDYPVSESERFPNQDLGVEDLFAVVEDAIEKDAHRLNVNYDAKLGYPRRIDLEYSKERTDDDTIYEMINLEPAPPNR